MSHAEVSTGGSAKSIMLSVVASLTAVMLAAGFVALIGARPARALPQYATQTGLPCSQCHQTATGGPLTDFGKAFQANGHKVPEKK